MSQYGTVSYSSMDRMLMGQEIHGRNFRLFCSRVCAKVIKVFPFFYLVLLSWRFVGLIIYAYDTSQSMCYRDEQGNEVKPETLAKLGYEKAIENTTVEPTLYVIIGFACFDFSSFQYSPSPLTEAWQTASIFNTLLVVLVLVKVPGYDGYLPTFRKNAKHARFWSLFLQLLLSIIYKCVVIVTFCQKYQMLYPVLFVTLFIFEEILSTLAVYFWSGVPDPWKDNPRVFARRAHIAYRLTLVVFLLEKCFLFLLSSLHAASSAGNLKNNNDVIITALNTADATFLYSLMKIFWNKLFYGERNLLINDN